MQVACWKEPVRTHVGFFFTAELTWAKFGVADVAEEADAPGVKIEATAASTATERR